MRCLLVLIALLALVATACSGSSSSASVLPDGEGGVYLALGDSIAYGEHASDPEATDYVARVYDALRARYGDGLRLESLAVGGHTTQDLIDEQLSPALDLIAAGDVRAVTITIGGNDLYVLAGNAVCPTQPESPDCPFDDIIAGTEERLETILGALREAGPDTAIVIEDYPDLFSGTGHPFEEPAAFSFGRLNDLIDDVAARHDVLVADPRPPFVGRADDLTGVLDAQPDFHPNDAGYAIIAAAFLEVMGL